MSRDADGSPRVEPTARGLGVRPHYDVIPDRDGIILPGNGGMSVNPRPDDLPRWLLKRNCVPWVLDSDELPDSLAHRWDSKTHGLIEPARAMRLDDFQVALTETRAKWREAD